MKAVITIITHTLKSELNKANKITIVGYYGVNNLGDDLMLKSIVDELSTLNIKINVIGFGDIKWLDKTIDIIKWKKRDNVANLKILRDATRDSDLIMWGGGTCFTDEDGDGMFMPMNIAKLLGKKIFYVGVGIGNLNRLSRRLKAKWLINISSYISFRDANSYRRGLEWKKSNKSSIEKIEDPANYALEKMLEQENIKFDESAGMVVAWRELGNYSSTTIGNNLAKVVDQVMELAKKYSCTKITIIDTDSSCDGLVSRNLFKELSLHKGLEVNYNETVDYDEKIKILAQAKIVLTSRLHIGVISDYFSKECYVYNYSPKIEYFVETSRSGKVFMLHNV